MEEFKESYEKVYTFNEVIDHQGPLTKANLIYKGSVKYILVLWDEGLQTYEPRVFLIKDDPGTLGTYAR
jgi:hypothetical protein